MPLALGELPALEKAGTRSVIESPRVQPHTLCTQTQPGLHRINKLEGRNKKTMA
jgi:hypothetical protein